jgi:hypothetical protein
VHGRERRSGLAIRHAVRPANGDHRFAVRHRDGATGGVAGVASASREPKRPEPWHVARCGRRRQRAPDGAGGRGSKATSALRHVAGVTPHDASGPAPGATPTPWYRRQR